MDENHSFDKTAEERTMAYFSFSAKVFHWCRIALIPVAVACAAMTIYAWGRGRNPAEGLVLLLCIMFFAASLPKRERAYQQYAQEAQTAIEQGSTSPYSQKALELRSAQQRAGKGTCYLIAGMVIFLGVVCAAGGLAIMLLGGSLFFWGFPILVLSLPCFLLGVFYLRMGRSARR